MPKHAPWFYIDNSNRVALNYTHSTYLCESILAKFCNEHSITIDTNSSDNRYLHEVLQSAISRKTIKDLKQSILSEQSNLVDTNTSNKIKYLENLITSATEELSRLRN